MNPLQRRRTRLALAALGALGALAMFVGVAAAFDVTGTANLSGTLAVNSPSAITFTGGVDVVTTYDSDTTDPIHVVNAGDTNQGWHVTAYYNGFSCSTGSGFDGCTNGDPLGDTLTLNGTGSTSPSDGAHGPTSSCYTGVGTCTVATPMVTSYPAPVPVGNSSPATVYDASSGSGIGGISADDVWWLTVPANAKPGTYLSTITLAVNTP